MHNKRRVDFIVIINNQLADTFQYLRQWRLENTLNLPLLLCSKISSIAECKQMFDSII